VNIRENISLRPYHTFHTEVKARRFAEAGSTDELRRILDSYGDEPVLFLGEGSNVLFLNDFEGTVIRNEIKGLNEIRLNDREVLWEIGGGENWHETVRRAVERNLAGMENLALIPGKAGTAPVQNIGAYGREIKDILHSCDVLDLHTGKTRTFSNSDCAFGYRQSLFKQPENRGRYFIYRIRVRLTRNGEPVTTYRALQEYFRRHGIVRPDIKDVFNAVVSIRREKLPDPAETGNAGSFFKNPVVDEAFFRVYIERYPEAPYYALPDKRYKIPAGWLIDRAGWKGYREGDAGVHPKQALVLVNYGNASGRDIYRLSEKIRRDISDKYGIDLEREVTLVGRTD